ncbi:MAG: hypothetical protein K5872_08465 [Rhizobiaceae bacterium]|nr:hypothetical protein [Rhizobiaceae bacterium]MCV0406248.1 hypothetical protein [Rhizobiaceae bacterium]
MKTLMTNLSEAVAWLRDLASRISVRGERQPIADFAALCYFVRTRSALVTQKKLYGYLKERMGLSYPRVFEDDEMVASINIAKMHVFAAGLSDLTIHSIGQISRTGGLDPEMRVSMACDCYRRGIEEFRDQAPDDGAVEGWLADFERRVNDTHWENLAAGASPFTASPKALVRWAPIADEHKKYDVEIVENSIRFAWNEVRQDLRARLDGPSVAADYAAGTRH